MVPEKAASRAYPTWPWPSTPSMPGGSFAFTAAVVIESATRDRLVLLGVAESLPSSSTSASITKRSRASRSREHHTSSRASCGHCFVRCFEGA
jgi:hypothetical protein